MPHKKSRKHKLFDAVIASVVCILIFVFSVLASNIDLSNLFGFPANFDINSDFVRIIDVGQGDSILIYSNGYSALIDTGLSTSSSKICTVLEDCKIKKLDVLLITHFDNDHIGGAETLCELYGADKLIMPKIPANSEYSSIAESLITNVKQNKGEVYTAKVGMNFKIGEFEVTVLSNDSSFESENNRSIVSAAKISGRKFLFMADIEYEAENRLLESGLDLSADVLKVGHHGSSTSSKYKFLKEVNPKYAAISVDGDNDYEHPHSEVLSALEKVNAEIYRTDRDGDITFYVKSGKIVTNTEK